MTFLKKNKKLLIALFLIALVGFGGYLYIFQKPEEVSEIKPSFIGTSKDFISKNSAKITEWNTKIIEITGTISSVSNEGVILDHNVFCQFLEDQKLNTLNENQTITVKGMVIGYDDLLDELKLNQCTLKK
ncbi:hypothetical protein [Tenacibaculum jejuense]|uniref:tRNA_anti-like n=1 Tax=Tenacibaculum jejuense TaxID=584609 RepID=A0A238U770_9FLAO|nr:hypothetical protein [Tenacibaculum jejuense]SNR14324.1 conserved protein of unknown function [Tenacibaculum jejuense]